MSLNYKDLPLQFRDKLNGFMTFPLKISSHHRVHYPGMVKGEYSLA
ncbi:MAG: hypothetical protein ACP5QC_00010 [Caldimicrobium sp.]